MFDPKYYREACGRLTLGQEKIEEMISMTEDQNKKRLHRPARMLLIAAALVSAMCVTVAAAEVPGVKEFFATVFVTINTDNNMATGLNLPNVTVEKQEERTILHVNGEAVDVTDALAQDGAYLYEGDGFTVEVDENGAAVVTAYGADGTVVSYSTEEADRDTVVYQVICDEEGDGTVQVKAIGGDADMIADYDVVTDQGGAVSVYSADGK